MKIFTHRIFTHRKIIVIFFLAIIFPSLIVGYLSIGTFSKRRDAVKKLLESNLWVTGEAGLKSIEEALLEYENKVLNSGNFIHLIQPGQVEQPLVRSSLFSADSTGQLFCLMLILK